MLYSQSHLSETVSEILNRIATEYWAYGGEFPLAALKVEGPSYKVLVVVVAAAGEK